MLLAPDPFLKIYFDGGILSFSKVNPHGPSWPLASSSHWPINVVNKVHIFFVSRSYRLKLLILILPFVIYSSFTAAKCTYGKKDECPVGQYCIKVDKNKTLCKKVGVTELPIIDLPFKSQEVVMCDQGPLSPEGNSHTWENTAFALDLYTDRNDKKTKPVFSSLSGKVISYGKCKTVNDQCGLGFGNQVKVLSDNGVMIFYAHLEKVVVETGTQIEKKTLIGFEGMTGWTGEDNPHLHTSMHYDWRAEGYGYWKNVGYLPPAIPFKINLCRACSPDCVEETIDIRAIKCNRTSSKASTLCRK